MFTITLDDTMLEKLRGMLEDEEDDVCVRLREYQVGGGWHAKIILSLGMDEKDDDEDSQIMIDDVPFIAHNDFLLKYGNNFALSFSAESGVVVSIPEQ